MKRKNVIRLEDNEDIEIRDANGYVLFSLDRDQLADEGDPAPEYADPWDVDVRTYESIAEGLLDFPEVKSAIGGMKELVDWSDNTDNAWIEVGNCVDRSTIGFRLYFGDLFQLMCEVELDPSKTALLRHFMAFVSYGAINIDFARGAISDPVMRLLDDHICEEWPHETLQEIAGEALGEYERNTTGKALFKQIFESSALTEFREYFDTAISGYLRLEKVLKSDEVCEWVSVQLRDRARLSPDDAEATIDSVFVRFWEDSTSEFPLLIN